MCEWLIAVLFENPPYPPFFKGGKNAAILSPLKKGGRGGFPNRRYGVFENPPSPPFFKGGNHVAVLPPLKKGGRGGFPNNVLLFLLTLFLASAAFAVPPDTLPAVQGPVILTVKGKLAKTNSPFGARFDLPLLEQFPLQRITTTTRWTNGPQRFEGVVVSELLEYLGAEGEYLDAIALDNYSSPDISLAELKRYGVIIALKKNGDYIPVRERGPLWLIYPLDSHPELNREPVTQYKLIWHLRTLILQ